MILDALLAYLHFTAIFLLYSFLVVQVMLARQTIDAKAIRLLARVDRWAMFAAIAALLTGMLRVFMGAKGAAFYANNPIFFAKVVLFFIIGGLTVIPTMQYLGWMKAIAVNDGFVVSVEEQKKLRRYLMIVIHLAVLLPLLAVLMSRGIGH